VSIFGTKAIVLFEYEMPKWATIRQVGCHFDLDGTNRHHIDASVCYRRPEHPDKTLDRFLHISSPNPFSHQAIRPFIQCTCLTQSIGQQNNPQIMCEYTQVEFRCPHVRYTVRAWCIEYETTHICCRPQVVAVEFQYGIPNAYLLRYQSKGFKLMLLKRLDVECGGL
jgi:hypothetical protein